MDNSDITHNIDSSGIRSQFDEILNRHIHRLTNTKDTDDAIPLSLVSIACLYLSVERENEIKAFPESPPERYTRQAFLKDLEEIGIEPDDNVMLAIQDLAQYNFVKISGTDQYTATDAALEVIRTLEAIFPYMPGMSLVAYVSQSMDEVASGRKELSEALENFDQTLEKQGITISEEDSYGFKTLSKSDAHQRKFEKLDPALVAKRRAAHLNKLKALREKSLAKSKDPTIVSRQGYFNKVEIREVFPKAQPAPPEGISVTDTTVLDHGGPSKVPHIETATTDSEGPLQADDTASPNLEETREESARDTELPDEDSAIPDEAPQDPGLSKEELISQQIQAYEAELAMPCPVCHTGKVLSDETEKGKVYYHCSNEECKLISWGKPYHSACPVCKNPFLIEFSNKEGSLGLKCPRATCQFRKENFDGTSLPNGSVSSTGKKLVAVRKKKGKKGVRRVVRRRRK